MNINAMSVVARFFVISVACAALLSCKVTVNGQDKGFPFLDKTGNLITIKTPVRRFPDSVFNKKIGHFTVSDVEVSSKSQEQSSRDISVETNVIDLLLLLEDWNKRIRSYDINTKRAFSFALLNGDQEVGSSHCLILASFLKQTQDGQSNTSNANNLRQYRKTSTLLCAITSQDALWQLKIDKNACGQIVSHFASPSRALTINTLEWNNKPDIDGFTIDESNETLSALAINGDPSIWYNPTLNDVDEVTNVILAYNLIMHSWLDSDWQRTQIDTHCQ